MKLDWLSKELRDDVRRIFEPRYQRKLEDSEVTEIAENLTNYLELILKHRYENQKINT